VSSVLLSPGGDNIHRGATAADSLIVGTVDGIFVLARAADGEWALAHRALPGCFVSALTRLANGTLIAGVHQMGLARSTDEGRTWRWINSGITHHDVWVAKALTIGGAERIYAGTMPAHLFVSDDGGDSWRELPALRALPTTPKWYFPPPPHLGHVKEIAAHGDQLLVGIEVGALAASRDRGASSVELPVDPDPSECDIHRVVSHPARPDRLIAATGFGLVISDDGGRSWRRGSSDVEYPDPIVVHPDDPDLMFVAGAIGIPPQWYQIGRARGQIARSRDGGMSWQRLRTGLPDGQRAAFGAMTLAAWRDGYAVYVADTDGQVFESRDGGESWCIIAETGGVSKGDFHIALAKGRARMSNIDDVKFSGSAGKRYGSVET
jgi:photosystem II stability/assembly factor-like uncharacterized protein